jgi:AcrR family transcriptional regulator
MLLTERKPKPAGKPKGKAKPKTYNPERTRASLLKSGLELFGNRGYHATSVGDIAEAAGTTKGAFYHHFKSKEELLLVIHDEYVAHQLAAIEGVTGGGRSASEQLRGLVLAVVSAVDRYRPHVQVFFQERRYLGKEQLATLRRKRDRLEKALIDVLELGVRNGEFRGNLDVRVACLGILGMCAWTYQWFSSAGRLSAEQVSEEFCRIVLSGLQK